MAWDSSRPVPYRRLYKEWLIYAAIMMVVYALFLRDSTNIGGMVVGLGLSFPLWIGLSYVLAKFGYQRKTLAEMRAARAGGGSTGSSRSGSRSGGNDGAGGRTRPAPTRRTSPGHNNPRHRKRR